MMIDQRVYATIYAILVLGWLSALIPLGRAKPGSPTFRLWMDRTTLIMRVVGTSACLTVFINFLDWLWS